MSRQCAHCWVRRFHDEGLAGLTDRSSRPHHMPSRTPAEAEDRVVATRERLRCGPVRISAAIGVAVRTVSRVVARRGVPRLGECDPLTGQRIRATRHTTRRYEHPHTGDLLHLDVKKIGKIPSGGGWRAHGRGIRPRMVRGLGYDYVHAAVDDHSRLAYAEILNDERGVTCAGFLLRAASWFAANGIPRVHRVLTDNAKNYLIYSMPTSQRLPGSRSHRAESTRGAAACWRLCPAATEWSWNWSSTRWNELDWTAWPKSTSATVCAGSARWSNWSRWWPRSTSPCCAACTPDLPRRPKRFGCYCPTRSAPTGFLMPATLRCPPPSASPS
ncbi:integrase family protein [Actinoalloteichus fjordicus]|uniref:Integrase family protein n=1 Tax=Actinoalloteichus fjordicus TaxID=1612552 RepID=A0AAC9PSS9_9PSEU|nr:integrase family protein [Actinoalloteichus fjordicus]